MLHKPDGENALALSPDEPPVGTAEPHEFRWLDATGSPQWRLSRTANNHLTVHNHATDTDTLWVADDDTLHVQSIAVEGESQIDAGTLDGLDSDQFVRSDTASTVNADLSVAGTLSANGNTVLTTGDEGELNAGTLDGATLAETRPSVAADGSTVETALEQLTAGQYLNATSDGDGGVTLDSHGGNAVGTTATATGDGTQTTFTVSHDLGGTPASVGVTPLTDAAMADHYVDTVRTDDLDITYASPPADGATLEWYVTAFGNDGSGTHAVAVQDDGTTVEHVTTLDFADGVTASAATTDTATITAGTDVLDDGTTVQSTSAHLDFGDNISATTDGDGVTVTGTDTYPSVAADGDEVDPAPGVVNFANNLSVTDTNDGVTIHATSDASTLGGVSATNYLRSDTTDTHDDTLGLTTLDGADGPIDLAADIAPSPGLGLASTVGSSTHHITPRRDGLQSLAQGGALPTDYGAVLEADATLAFIEPDNDRISGWVNTNDDSLTMAGGIRVGDAGGSPADGVALDVRGQIRGHIEVRNGDPDDPEPGRMWLDASAFE